MLPALNFAVFLVLGFMMRLGSEGQLSRFEWHAVFDLVGPILRLIPFEPRHVYL